MGTIDELFDRYRASARRKLASVVDARVLAHGNITPMPDGAFVEATIWIDRRDIDQRDQRVSGVDAQETEF